MYCMNCGLELPEDAKFCRKCAMPLIQCPDCGEDLPKKAKFCWRCGKSFAESTFSETSDPSDENEGVLPQRADNASIFARLNSAKAAEAEAQNDAPSPFRPAGAAKRESGAASYSPAGIPSAFKPASEKKKEKEEHDQPAPSPYNRFADAASPFKPLGSAKTETNSARPAAPRGSAAVSGSRPAAPRGAATVAGSRPSAPRGAATVAGSRPAASLRPEAPEDNEAPKETLHSSAPASPFKPVGSSKTGTGSRPAAPRGAAAVAGSRPAAPRGAAAVAGSRPAAAAGRRPAASAPRAAMRPAAQAAKEEPVKEAPAAAPSGPFKPFAPAKTQAASAKPAASSAFRPVAANEEPVIENEAPVEPPRPSPPVTFVPSGLFKPLDEPKETPEASAPQTPSPFASAMSSSPFASGSAFSPLSSNEPDLEVPKKSFGFTAYRPNVSTTEEKSEEKKPVNPTAMFHMNSNTGAMSSLSDSGSGDYGSLSSLGTPGAGSLMSDGFGDSDEKLPEKTDDSHPRFFRRPSANTETSAPEITTSEKELSPNAASLMPKASPLRSSALSGPSPFRQVKNVQDEDKPYVREPGASPFKPLDW
ncbi:MAG: zinc-ribbon domain-containing protein [Clostridiales bacterium]|nr:zinc-ribbon domain-containing protein [Clostridiales bacterium]